MATNDCSLLIEKPCPCGKGTVEVLDCMPDHPWVRASQRFLKSKLDCDECSRVYQIEDRSRFDLGPVVIVERALVEKREELLAKWYETGKEILASPEAEAIIQSFIDLLDAQSSMAAMHRLLTSHEFHVSSIASFRQSVKGPDGVAGIVRGFQASSLSKMMAALGTSDPKLEKVVQDLKDLWEAAHAPLPVVGEPIVGLIKK